MPKFHATKLQQNFHSEFLPFISPFSLLYSIIPNYRGPDISPILYTTHSLLPDKILRNLCWQQNKNISPVFLTIGDRLAFNWPGCVCIRFDCFSLLASREKQRRLHDCFYCQAKARSKLKN